MNRQQDGDLLEPFRRRAPGLTSKGIVESIRTMATDVSDRLSTRELVSSSSSIVALDESQKIDPIHTVSIINDDCAFHKLQKDLKSSRMVTSVGAREICKPLIEARAIEVVLRQNQRMRDLQKAKSNNEAILNGKDFSFKSSFEGEILTRAKPSTYCEYQMTGAREAEDSGVQLPPLPMSEKPSSKEARAA